MHHVFYVPGLGDHKAIKIQRKLMNRWPKKDTTLHVFPSDWHTKETSEQKYKRLVQFYNNVKYSKNDVHTIIGVSAGGPLTVRLAHECMSISHIYLVVGKLKGSLAIGKKYSQNAPALIDTVINSEKLLEKTNNTFLHRTIVVRSLFDTLIPLQDMLVPEAKTVKLPAIGHTLAIVYALRFYFPKQLRRITKTAQTSRN